LRPCADVCGSKRRSGIIDFADAFSKSSRHRDRFPRTNLGPWHISLPDPAAASRVRYRRLTSIACGLGNRPCLSLRPRSGLVTGAQDRVVKVGRVCFARIKCDDDPLVPEIDFYVVHSLNFHEGRAELLDSTMVILALGGDLDRLQNRMIGALGIEGVGWIGIVWSCRVHRFHLFNVRQRRSGRLSRCGRFALRNPVPARSTALRRPEDGGYRPRAIGSRVCQTFSARIFWPAALGWMPSGKFNAGSPATPSRRYGTKAAPFFAARSVNIFPNAET